MKRIHWIGALAVVSTLLAGSAAAQTTPPGAPSTTRAPDDSSRVRRLAKLGLAWGEIRYRHPYLATRAIDWDSALIAALPAAEAAADSRSYAAVVQRMISALGDPATGLLYTPPRDSLPRPAVPFLRREGATLVVTLATASQGGPSPAELASLSEEISRAKAALFDFRARPGNGHWARGGESAVSSVLAHGFTGEISVPGSHWPVYSGYPPPDARYSSYTLSLHSEAGTTAKGTSGHKPERIAILLDERTPLPRALFALRQQGRAFLVGEGFPHASWAVPQEMLDLGEGVKVETRLEELGMDERVDAIVPSRTGREARDPAFDRAKDLLRRAPARARPLPAPARPQVMLRADLPYVEPLYPDRAHRQLAAIRLWNVIRLFYPYQHLLDGEWGGALERFLPRFESASNLREYVAAVHEMAALVKDSHTRVLGGSVDSLLGGRAVPPIEVLDIEGKAVVVEVLDPAVTPGVNVGDVVEKVGGVPMEERIRQVRPYVTAATPWGLRRREIEQALAGADSVVTLTLRGSKGAREVSVPRSRAAWMKAVEAVRSAEPYRVLPGNVGYVSLKRLQPHQVDSMFLALQDTRAIVFDLRCYPNGTAWPIAPHINTRRAKSGALFRRPLVTPGGAHAEWYQFEQSLPVADVPLYKGRTITLIDERAISQSEHTCLFFEAANATTFVGSPTVGSNGDVTRLLLPGGLAVMFTGHDVRYADGRQLQRVGIQPHVSVRPTIAGLRAGRDEVLERALRLVDERASAKK